MNGRLSVKSSLAMLAAGLGALGLINHCATRSDLHALAKAEKDTSTKLVLSNPKNFVDTEVVVVAQLAKESRESSLFYSPLFGPPAVNSVFAGESPQLFSTTYWATVPGAGGMRVLERYAGTVFGPPNHAGICEIIGTVKPLESGSGFFILVDRVPIQALD